MKKIKTLDDFAIAIHKDYLSLDKKFGGMVLDFNGMKATLKDVQDDISHIKEIMVSKADLKVAIHEKFENSEYGRRLDKLEGRMDVVESKVGLA